MHQSLISTDKLIMGTINITKSTTDNTITIFDSFFEKEIKINAAEYDQVNAYFKSQLADDKIANDFTAVVFEIAQGYNQTVEETLNSLKGQTGIELTATVAYYLNGLRSKATLLGVTAIQQPNVYAARNILV